MEDFDPVEVFVAIADFKGTEESNVSLRAGQCVQVRVLCVCVCVCVCVCMCVCFEGGVFNVCSSL